MPTKTNKAAVVSRKPAGSAKPGPVAKLIGATSPVAKPGNNGTTIKPGDILIGTKPDAKPATNAPLGTADAAHSGNITNGKRGKRTSATASTVAEPAVAEAAKPSRDVSRTASTIAKLATNFGGLTDRDNAYIAFFAGFAKRGNGTVTIAEIKLSGLSPNYGGSAKPYDAGVCVRLHKAGVIAVASDGASFAFTPSGKTLASYASGK